MAVNLLSDWDLPKTREHVPEPDGLQSFRSGTLQFMSAARQWLPWKPHVLADDLESILHILNWVALKFMKHRMSSNPAMLLHHIHTHFDSSITGQCTPEKLEFVKHGIKLVNPGKEYEKHPFVVLLRALSDLCMRQYAGLDPEEFEDDPSGWMEAFRTQGQAPLNTHKAILEAFERALDPDQWEAAARKPLAKLTNQVDGEYHHPRPSAPSNEGETSMEAGEGGK
ncbi:hypothetical protein FKP32DRAFT_1677992 [Trametes sanguinea]|nr:hypothetical protein FKP32DRAFT_1677992 [Trametes sanguinea]